VGNRVRLGETCESTPWEENMRQTPGKSGSAISTGRSISSPSTLTTYPRTLCHATLPLRGVHTATLLLFDYAATPQSRNGATVCSPFRDFPDLRYLHQRSHRQGRTSGRRVWSSFETDLCS
jgi:hypothetical protein